MKVRELIEQLSKMDGELDVRLHENCAIEGIDEIESIKYEGAYPAPVKSKIKYVALETDCWCGVGFE